MPSQPREQFFVTCAPGLEGLLQAEMKDLGLAKVERQVGGVYFEGALRDAWRANLKLRTAVRVLMRVARFRAADADELYAGAQGVDWARFVRPDGTLVVDAHSKHSALDHTLFIAQRVKDAIVDAMREKHGARPTVAKDGADVGVYAHLFKDRCTLLVDTSGDSLHKRGWRKIQGRAPLAETLAAALVLASGWDRHAPLVDPFCGSGTVLIEAALLAGNVAPGLFRESFGFERWVGHDAAAWQKLREEARAAIRHPAKLVLLGRDVDPSALEGAQQNVAAAGLEGRIAFELGDVLEYLPKKGWNAWIVSNPPYGERLGEAKAVAELHRGLGALLRGHCGGFHVALLGPKDSFARALGLRDAASLPVTNGGLECEIVTAVLPR